MKEVKFRRSNKSQIKTHGNLALKLEQREPEYEKPKILKLVIGKSKNKVFAGCWQVANQEDSC